MEAFSIYDRITELHHYLVMNKNIAANTVFVGGLEYGNIKAYCKWSNYWDGDNAEPNPVGEIIKFMGFDVVKVDKESYLSLGFCYGSN